MEGWIELRWLSSLVSYAAEADKIPLLLSEPAEDQILLVDILLVGLLECHDLATKFTTCNTTENNQPIVSQK